MQINKSSLIIIYLKVRTKFVKRIILDYELSFNNQSQLI